MPGSLRDRFAVLRAALQGDMGAVNLPLSDWTTGALAWYGFARSSLGRRLDVRPATEGLVWVDIGVYGLLWPKESPLDRLVTTLVELRARTNPHYYFREPTPIRPGDHVIDVGGCEGAFGLEAIVTHGAARVWCFEPGATMVAALRQTAELNHLEDRLHVVPVAAGAESGVCQFVENAADPLSSRVGGISAIDGSIGIGGSEVRQVALDEWAEAEGVERIDYVKVDAEGSDVAVLEGARALLRRCRPRIAATTYHAPDHCERMIRLLEALDVGYRVEVRGVVAFDGIVRPVMLHATVDP